MTASRMRGPSMDLGELAALDHRGAGFTRPRREGQSSARFGDLKSQKGKSHLSERASYPQQVQRKSSKYPTGSSGLLNVLKTRTYIVTKGNLEVLEHWFKPQNVSSVPWS